MSQGRKFALSRMFDLPFALAALTTVGFYWFISQPAMEKTLLHRYTTEHAVEYVIVAFFIWGISDLCFRILTFPREMYALRQDVFPARTAREPVARAAVLSAQWDQKPNWFKESRLGQRLNQALLYLIETGSAVELGEYLRYLADQDEERTHGNYALVRFIGWVTPVLGFLGTVLHFGTALGGLSADEMSAKLPVVVGEMGTAFNTTTAALTAATTMMFGLFLCERTERGILHSVTRKTERDLLNRFEVADANVTPFLAALQSTNQATLDALDAAIRRQLEIWSQAFNALQTQDDARQERLTKVWESALEKAQQRFEANDLEREKRFRRLIDSVEARHNDQKAQIQASVDQLATLRADFTRLVDALKSVSHGQGNLLELQSSLAENLRLLRETQQMDEAMHGLTAAIHLLTARHQPPAPREHRAA